MEGAGVENSAVKLMTQEKVLRVAIPALLVGAVAGAAWVLWSLWHHGNSILVAAILVVLAYWAGETNGRAHRRNQ